MGVFNGNPHYRLFPGIQELNRSPTSCMVIKDSTQNAITVTARGKKASSSQDTAHVAGG